MNQKNIETILKAYLVCALWSLIDDNGKPFDENYKIDDFSQNAKNQAKKDIENFIDLSGKNLDHLDDSLIGTDFWLTRNRHGVGFWDRVLGLQGQILTKNSHTFGECYIYVNDENKLELN